MTDTYALLVERTTPDGLREVEAITSERVGLMRQLGWVPDEVTIHSLDCESLDKDAAEQTEDLFTETPAFGPPVGTVGHFNPAWPAFEQRVEINEATGSECSSFFHIDGSRRVPARYFQLSYWADALPLCEACMPRDIGVPRRSEPPTNAENAAPTEPPQPICSSTAPDGTPCEHAPGPRHPSAHACRDGNGTRVVWTEPRASKKASHFIRAIADEMVPPLRSGTYAELERHDHKRMRAELEAIIRYLDDER